jgi:hypothetical protein
LLLLLGLASCDRAKSESETGSHAARSAALAASSAPQTESGKALAEAETASAQKPKAKAAKSALSFPARLPQSGRLVAIGEVHGDLAATRQVLILARAIDESDHWTGGDLTVVQTGDQIDRGDDDRAILELFDRLETEARAAGGRLIALNGNHETMNALGDFRYVTDGAFAPFHDLQAEPLPTALKGRIPPAQADRARAFLPGGPMARLLAKRPIAQIVGRSAFVHGGLTAEHAALGLDAMNAQAAAWLEGKGPLPRFITDQNGPLWMRDYSLPVPSTAACELLARALAKLDVDRIVVGHTVQSRGINPACDNHVWRIDVGISKHYGGESLQVLEIEGDRIGVLTAPRR